MHANVPQSMPPPGARLGPYVLAKQVCSNGKTAVWTAKDDMSGADVIIKHLGTESTEHDLSFLRQEAVILQGFNHPGIVRYIGDDTNGPVPYLALELLRGPTLLEMATGNGGRLEWEMLLPIVTSLASTYAHINEKKLVYADIKPSNVIITPAGPVVIDFGISHIEGDSPLVALFADPIDASCTAGPVGSPGYASPEQLMGQIIGPQSDVFSFGIMAYTLLAGRRPFCYRNHSLEVCRKHINKPARPIDELVPSLPEALSALITSCIQKRPENRPQGFRKVLADLQSPSPRCLTAA